MWKDELIILEPKSSQEVWDRFDISGWVPKSWLKGEWGDIDYRIFLDFIDIEGKTFVGTTINVEHGPFSIFRKRLKFRFRIDCRYAKDDFSTKSSHGRITFQLSWPNKEKPDVFIPVVIKNAEPKEGVNPDFIDKHSNIGEMITRYEEDLKNYYREWGEIRKSRVLKEKISENEETNRFSYSHDWEVASRVRDILDEAEDAFENYPYSEEDKKERELEEKYKDALAWKGPLFGGVAGRLNGYEFRIYSHDHDKHFHVIHKGRGINARFSFPSIRLLNYKRNPTSISSKDTKRIQEYFQVPAHFQKLETEFTKRK